MKFFSPLEVFNINFYGLNTLIFSSVFFVFFFTVTGLIIYLNFIVFAIKIKNIKTINFLSHIFFLLNELFFSIVFSKRASRFFPFLFSMFMLILVLNFTSLCFYQVPFTAHIFVTFFFVFLIFFCFFVNNLINFDYKFFLKFVQKGLNIYLTFLLYLIEIISYMVKPISLSVRLFANMLSGHILLHVFFSFYIFLYKIFIFFSFIILFFCFFILVLEIFVSIIQSYIFLILSLVYLNDIYFVH